MFIGAKTEEGRLDWIYPIICPGKKLLNQELNVASYIKTLKEGQRNEAINSSNKNTIYIYSHKSIFQI